MGSWQYYCNCCRAKWRNSDFAHCGRCCQTFASAVGQAIVCERGNGCNNPATVGFQLAERGGVAVWTRQKH